MNANEIKKITEAVNNLVKTSDNSLPDNSFILDENAVLCYPRKYGDTRYPYYNDGLVMFAHSGGYIDCVEGMFNIFRIQHYNEDTPVCFYAGEPTSEGFFPVSVTGAARQLFEPCVLKRYTVYTPVCVWYITECTEAVYALCATVDKDKHLRFSFGALNTGSNRQIYLASFFEPMLSFDDAEGFYHRMIKYGEHFENGSYVMHSRNKANDCLSIVSRTYGEVTDCYFTTAKKCFLGIKGGNLTNAVSLKNGCPTEQISKTNTTDIPCANDFVHFDFKRDSFVSLEYDMLVTDDLAKAFDFANSGASEAFSDLNIKTLLDYEKAKTDKLNVSFGKWKDETINSNVFNTFIKFVQRQVSFCALGKNYAGSMLGIRDVFQQLETSLIWQPDESRNQIVRVMNFILDSGRAPRQISFPTAEKPIPDMDLRPFIDQGFWIISAIHTYISYTNDKTLLDEICTYYTAEATFGPLSESGQKDSILCHLIRITDNLISNIDASTGCVRALWGDWNDALDGLGKTDNPDEEFGSGVSVMATEQLYLSLGQMCELLEYVGGYEETSARYNHIRNKLAKNFRKFAVETSGDKSRILHGWGDKRAYLVGSICDYDGKDRLSLTSNAYYAVSGLCELYEELNDGISNSIMSMDSKYGLMTFSEPFDGYASEVGRISTITPGTFENASVYIHASTFGIMALFAMGRSKEAWEMLCKAVVVSHLNTTKTTFVMPNSYCYSEEYSSDGDSMSDWYTGSGTVLIKELIRYGFGIMPSPGGITIAPPSYMPSDGASVELYIKGVKVCIEYVATGEGRKIIINGDEALTEFDSVMRTSKIFIANENIKDDIYIKITD